MKKFIAILNIFLWAFQLYAQQNLHIRNHPRIAKYDNIHLQGHVDSMGRVVEQFIMPVIFNVNKYDIQSTPQLKKAVESILNHKRALVQIWVKGSTSPEGPSDWNLKLGQYRAKALVNYLSRETGLDDSMFRICNLGEDWSSLKEVLENRVDFPNKKRIQTIISEEQDNDTRKRKIQELDGGKTWQRLVEEVFPPLRNARLDIVAVYPRFIPIASEIKLETPPIVPIDLHDLFLSNPIPVTINTTEGPKWKIAVKNNLLFDVLLVANLGLEISPWAHWSLDIPVWYSPYDISSTRNIRLLAVQPEIRWWPEEAMSGHFVGLHTHVAGFNIALNDYARYQDPNHALWGMGLSYGYAMSLGKSGRWGLEFTIGAGFAQYQYDAYHNERNGQRFKSGTDCYWGITRAGVTFSYKWEILRKMLKN